MPERLHIAFATPEALPWVKTGGLGDVAAALPKALARLGHEVTLLLPRYGSIAGPLGERVGWARVSVDALPRRAVYFRASAGPGVQVVFVDHPPFFDRPFPYGVGNSDYPDNRLRFAFFARAALEYFRSRGERPDVFHAHDWQSGLLPVYLKARYWTDPTLGRLPSVFTIHNVAYQGRFGADTLGILGLPPHLDTPETLALDGGVSYLKGGILFSEAVTTVSPRYAQEIQGPAGYGLDAALRSRVPHLTGILNGVDYDEWGPSVDRFIARRYGPEDLEGKAACKADLLRLFGLPAEPELPLVGAVSRLVSQKGFDLVAGAGAALGARPLRLVILGSGEPGVQAGLQALTAAAPDRFAVRFGYDDALAHRIQAGADLLLMPSRFEPCGLNQMYALRYGTVPVVHSTGGLVDTVVPYDPATGAGTGFRFDHADATGLLWALDQALAVYRDRSAWKQLMRRGMAQDFSWERSARSYLEVYRQAARRA